MYYCQVNLSYHANEFCSHQEPNVADELYEDLASYVDVAFKTMGEQERLAMVKKLINEAKEEAKHSSPEVAAKKLVETINSMRTDTECPPYYIVLEGRSRIPFAQKKRALPKKKKVWHLLHYLR